MTFRRVLALLLALAVGAALLLWARGVPDSPDTEVLGVAEASPGPDAGARERGARGSFAAAPASISGRVVETDGRPVPGAVVGAEGAFRYAVTADKDGAFVLGPLAADDYTLFANLGVRASEPLGPVPLGPGEELRELVLVLDAGAALSGTVLDARNGVPIAQAWVSAAAASVQADEAGRFRLVGLPGGRVVLTAWAEGFVQRTSEIELAQGRERTGAAIHLDRGARVHGVVTADGQPVSGATVQAARYGFAAGLSVVAPVSTTDSEGRFEGLVQPGRMALVARGGFWAEGRTEEFEVGPGDEREINLTLGAGGVIFGVIRDAQGSGAAGCRLQAFDSVHGRTTAETGSLGDGSYLLVGLSPAVYAVVAACGAGRAEAAGVSLAQGDRVQVDLELGVGVVAGQVVDSEGRPIGGAAIAIRGDGSAAPETPAGVSAADGSFEVAGLAGAGFTVIATAPQGRAERGGVAPGARGLVLRIASAELFGLVRGERGEAVSDFTVYAEPALLGGARPQSRRFLSATGAFRMPLEPGPWQVKVGAPGYVSATVPVEIRAGDPGSPVRFNLSRGATVRGRTVDDKDRPLEGVRVASHPHLLWAFGRAAPVANGASAVSGPGGEFELSGVASGERVRLFAQKEGFSQTSSPTVNPSGEGVAEGLVIRMRASGRGSEDDGEPEFGGIGMALTARDGAVIVTSVFEGGPAREAGLRPGDRILQVDAVPVDGANVGEVVQRVRGVVGTSVSLVIRRDGRDASVAVPRASVKF